MGERDEIAKIDTCQPVTCAQQFCIRVWGDLCVKKTLTFESVRGKVSSTGLELPVHFLMDSDAEVLRSLLLPASLAFLSKISRGESLLLIIVCHSMHNLQLSKPTARIWAGTWQLSLLRGSSQVLKPGWE